MSQPTFGDLLARYRVRADLSQGQLARRASYNISYISKIEQGTRAAPLHHHTVEAMIAPLNLSEDETEAMYLACGLASPRLQALCQLVPPSRWKQALDGFLETANAIFGNERRVTRGRHERSA